MVETIKRKKSDLFNTKIGAFLGNNKFFLFALRIVVLTLFLTALGYGIYQPQIQQYHFSVGLFWSFFWPFFMVVSLGTFGSIFCGICPYGFLGKYISRIGLKKTMPKWMQNPLIGLTFLVIFYWILLYLFPNILKSPLVTVLFFTTFTLIALISFFLFKDMSYCKYLCPIGSITTSFSKVSATKLFTYQEACLTCKGFECAKACPYHLSPFNFEKKNSMQECKLCMECAHACVAIGFSIQKPSEALFKIDKAAKKSHIWTYIIISCVASIAMILQNALGNSPISSKLPWKVIAKYFPQSFISIEGLIVLLLAIMITCTFTIGAYKLASKIYPVDFQTLFFTAGYAIAPMVIFGGMAQTIPFFFTHYGSETLNGILILFDSSATLSSSFIDKTHPFLKVFALLHFFGVFWGLWILKTRIKLKNLSNHGIGLFLLLGSYHFLYLSLIIFIMAVFILN